MTQPAADDCCTLAFWAWAPMAILFPFSKGGSVMEPHKDDLEQAPQPRPEEKKRRFRLVKLEEQRFRLVKLEERVAPTLIGGSGHPAPSGHSNTLCHTHLLC